MLTPKEIKERVKNKSWVSPFKRIVAVHDQKTKLVQIYEDHARGECRGAASWSAYHYKNTSKIVIDSWRDGARNIFLLKIGKDKVNLVPSFSSAGIEEVKIEKDEIKVTYIGLAGGGVGITLCRGLAKGVIGVKIHEEGGGDKVGKATLILPKMIKIHIGVDDTDKKGKGATWSLTNEIAYRLNKIKGIEYLNHTLVQLYPKTPNKTTNCVSTVLTFGVLPKKKEYLIKKFTKILSKETFSDDTGIAVFIGISIPEALVNYSNMARKKIVYISEALDIAKNVAVEIIKVTGENGIIGALAGLGYAEKIESAVIVENRKHY